MNKTISATEAVRKFSEVLNSIKYKEERYTIVRAGKPVASLCPAVPLTEGKTLGELKDLLKTLPPLGDEAETFNKDIKKIMRQQPFMPERSTWD